jgi:hypothetical protein
MLAQIDSLRITTAYDVAVMESLMESITTNDAELPPVVIDAANNVLEGVEVVEAARALNYPVVAVTVRPLETTPSTELVELTTTDVEVPACEIFLDDKRRLFQVEAIVEQDVVVTGGVKFSLTRVELNKSAIALLSDEQLKFCVNLEGDLVFHAISESLRRAKKAGNYLLEQKTRIKRGGWLPWLSAHCPKISDRTAQEWMQVAKNWDEIVKNAMQRGLDLESLTQSSALKLLRGGKDENAAPSSRGRDETAQKQPSHVTNEDIYLAFSSSLAAMPPRRIVTTLKQVSELFDSSRLAALDPKDLEELIHSSSSLIKQAKAVLKR